MKIHYDNKVIDASIKDNSICDIISEMKMPKQIDFDIHDDENKIKSYCNQLIQYCKNLKIKLPKFVKK